MNNQIALIWKKCAALVALVAVLVTLLPAVPVALADENEDEIEIELNLGKSSGKGKGGSFGMPGAPYISRGHFMAPLAAVANQLDCTVAYNAESKTVTLSRGQRTIVMTIGKTACVVNGVAAQLPIAPISNRGTTFVPIKFVVTALFGEVDLDFKWGRLKIKVKNKKQGGWDDDQQTEIDFEVVQGASLAEQSVNGPSLTPISRADLTTTAGLPADASLLAVIRGWFGNTGYSIETRRLVVENNKLTAYVDLKSPSDGNSYASVMTYVHQIIRLKDDAPEYSSWELRTTDGQLIGSSTGTGPSTIIAFGKPAGQQLKPDLRQLQINSPTLLIGTVDSLLENSGLTASTPALAAVWGQQNTAGYAIDVQKLELKSGVLVATVRLTTPTGYALPALSWVDQIVTLPPNMPAITGWEVRDEHGSLLNGKTLPSEVTFRSAADPDLTWVNQYLPGVESKLVTVGRQQKLLVVIKRGMCPTGGYDIQVNGLRVDAFGSIVADVTLTDPLPGTFNAQILTHPMVAVYVDPIFAGNQFRWVNISQPSEDWKKPVVVNASLKDSIDKDFRRVLTGYGRDLLSNPGDLSDVFLVVALRGECSSGGYSITVKEFIRVGDTVRVVVEERDPAPGTYVTCGLTYPYQIVKAPTGSEKLAFELYPGNPEQVKFSIVNYSLKSGVNVTDPGAVWMQGKDLFTGTGVANDWFVLVKRGFCPSSGYGMNIDCVQIRDQQLQVIVTEINPLPGNNQSSVVTFPYLVLQLQSGTQRLPLQMITKN